MWTKSYQSTRVAEGKKSNKYSEGQDFCTALIFGCFKNCIYCFIFVFFFAIAGTLTIIYETKTANLDVPWKNKIDSFTSYMNKHPLYYGMQKVGEKAGYNTTKSVESYLRKQMTETQYELGPHALMLHPLFVELQERSAMGPYKDYKIHRVKAMSVKQFYINHVAFSMPQYIEGDALAWPIV